jgi:hypothetical protein
MSTTSPETAGARVRASRSNVANGARETSTVLEAVARLPGAGLAYRAGRMRAEVYDAVLRSTVPVLSAPPPDALRPTDVPSVKELGAGDRVLAEIDQDGYAFAIHPADIELFNRREQQLPRIRYGLSIVLREGEVLVEKRFNRGRWYGLSIGHYLFGQLELPFFNEAAALVRLRQVEGVPRLRHIDLARRRLYVDYIHGTTLQRLVAEKGAPILDADGAGHGGADEQHQHERELAGYAPEREAHREPIERLFHAIVAAGVAPVDIKLGNVVVGAKTGAHYWIDFEIGHVASCPGHEEKLAEAKELARELFGIAT